MSPEVILKKPHNFSVDFFSLGVIVYELMMGKRPYNGKSRKELKEQIIYNIGLQRKIFLFGVWAI